MESGRIIEKYLLIYQIGSGHFSDVWMSVHMIDKKYYALKIMHDDSYEVAQEELALFITCKDNNHDRILRIEDVFTIKEGPAKYRMVLVFPVMAGNLLDLLKGKYSAGLPENIVRIITKQILKGIQQLHQEGKMHTDIKPDNILVDGRTVEQLEMIKKFECLSFFDNLDLIYKKNSTTMKEEIDALAKSVGDGLFPDYEEESDSEYESEEEDDEDDEEDEDWRDQSDDDDTIRNVKTKYNLEKKYTWFPPIKLTDEVVIDEKYIRDPNIYIADLGTCVDIDDHKNHEVCTSYYRPPEVILNMPYNQQIDVWSIGCTVFELLTGHILFYEQPNELPSGINLLFLMESILGPIPRHLFSKAKRAKIFYPNGKLIGVTQIKNHPLEKIMKQKKISSRMINFVKKCLIYDPADRATIDELQKLI